MTASSARFDIGNNVRVPIDANAVVEAVVQGLMLRGKDALGKNATSQLAVPGRFAPSAELTRAWRHATNRAAQPHRAASVTLFGELTYTYWLALPTAKKHWVIIAQLDKYYRGSASAVAELVTIFGRGA
ncbi:MAG: hypothetical protein CVU56_00580 [Deltaproteobacteria bacterium HGW-Deltaproteobacteria-14]|jgi:hypothetical protein|nr:MAG: hypothetical protein CVU56_00580 [Deltaproteobacteria bacterium HGW-Deltaproteobacteria-14]